MFDERTEYLDLRLPNLANPLSFECGRLRENFTKIAQYLEALDQIEGLPLGIATLDGNGKVPASQLPEMLATGVMLDYALKTLPSSAWRFCDGAALLFDDTPAAALRTKLIGDEFPYGQDAYGNPRVPDARGRVTAGKDNMGGTAASRLTSIEGTKLGTSGGAEKVALTVAQMPKHGHAITDPGHAHTIADPGHAHSVYDPGHVHTNPGGSGTGTAIYHAFQNGAVSNVNTGRSATGISIYAASTGISIYAAATGITVKESGGDEAHSNLQPTLVVNKIIKL